MVLHALEHLQQHGNNIVHEEHLVRMYARFHVSKQLQIHVNLEREKL
jgi:hypothetical protein